MTLQYIMAMLSELTEVALSEYNSKGQLLKRYAQHDENERLPDLLELMRKQFISECTKDALSVTFFEGLPVLFCGFISSETGSCYVWGPILWQDLNHGQQKRFEKHCCYEDGSSPVSKVSIRKLACEIAVVFSMIQEREVSIYEAIGWLKNTEEEQNYKAKTEDEQIKENVVYRMRVEDEVLSKHTYFDEQLIWSAVRRGDVDEVRRQIDQPNLEYPQIVKDDALKNESYLAVVAIGIISRVVIESGVPSSESFLLSDIYIKKISECKRTEEIHQIIVEFYIAFTELVRKKHQRSLKNRYVEGCKNIIATDIFKKISVADISDRLNIRATYLARVFKQHEGMTVTEYMHREKVATAANMLIYSDVSIAEISDYLQFCSQSYFSKIFKEFMGQTPKLYRLNNHSKRF